MKRFLITLLIILFAFSAACSKETKETDSKGSLEWLTNLEDALEIAKADEKAVLINFTGSDWCPWCWRLRDEIFVKDAFIDFAKESLVLVELDFPRNIEQTEETKRYNQALLQKYGVEGFPTILVLNAEGKLLLQAGWEPGGPEPYVAKIKEYIAR